MKVVNSQLKVGKQRERWGGRTNLISLFEMSDMRELQ